MQQDDRFLALAASLPQRNWVYLTEAATALAFGSSETADAFVSRANELEIASAKEHSHSARRAFEAAAAEGFPLEPLAGFAGEVAEIVPEVRDHIRDTERRRSERDGQWAALFSAERLILEKAQQGKVLLQGIFEGQKFAQPIDDRAAATMRAYRDVGLDKLLVKGTLAEISGVQVERAGLIRSFDATEVASPDSDFHKPAGHVEILRIASLLWPDGKMPARKTQRNKALDQAFRDQKQSPPHARTYRRAFQDKKGQ